MTKKYKSLFEKQQLGEELRISDLAGNAGMSDYKSLFKEWKEIKFNEDLRLSDFQNHAGISNFTKKWKDERQGIKGAGNVSVRIVRLIVNKKRDYVTFVFYSAPTYDFTARVVKPKSDFKINGKRPFYVQELRILDFFKWAKTTPGYKAAKYLSTDDLKDIFKVSSTKVFCTCPSFHWQGMNAIDSMFNASIYPTDIPPTQWRKFHNDDSFACKHLDILFSSIYFWLSPMASMLNKYLKEKLK